MKMGLSPPEDSSKNCSPRAAAAAARVRGHGVDPVQCVVLKVTLERTIAVPRLQNFRLILPRGFFPC